MLKIKRVYDPPSPEDGKRVLVDQLWPRGIRKEDAAIDEWPKEIAPTVEIRRWFGHDPAKYEEFKQRYAMELDDKADLIDRIKNEARRGTVTLLFSARDIEHNNATVLKEILER